MKGYNYFRGRPVFDGFLPHHDAGPVETLVFSPAQQALKLRMFQCYRTQLRVLKNFPLKVEQFRLAPRYDFLRPPHPGTLFYDRFGWRINGRVWCNEASQALRSLDLLNKL
jgi:hypothetical protein